MKIKPFRVHIAEYILTCATQPAEMLGCYYEADEAIEAAFNYVPDDGSQVTWRLHSAVIHEPPLPGGCEAAVTLVMDDHMITVRTFKLKGGENQPASCKI